MQIQGILKGKRIELRRKPKLPSGSKVLVRITPKILTLKEKRQIVANLCGAWLEDPSLTTIFTEIEKSRAVNMSREVNFNVAS